MTVLRPGLTIGLVRVRPYVPAAPPADPTSHGPSWPGPSSHGPSSHGATSGPPAGPEVPGGAARRGAAGVPLRVVSSRRFPVPAPAEDLISPGDPVTGRLLVDASRSVLSPHLRRRRLAVTVDGVRREWTWGRTPIELVPGRHLVEIEVEQAGHRGKVSETVPVAAGHVVEVFYRAPALPWSAGAVGPSVQRTPGRATVALGALVVLAALVSCLLLLTGTL